MARSLRCGHHQDRLRRSSCSLFRLPANVRARKLLYRGAAASLITRNMAPAPSKLWVTRKSTYTWRRLARPSLPEPFTVYDFVAQKRLVACTVPQRDGMAIGAEVGMG